MASSSAFGVVHIRSSRNATAFWSNLSARQGTFLLWRDTGQEARLRARPAMLL